MVFAATPFHNCKSRESCSCVLRNFGRFRLEKEIARGGMGIIFASRDVELDREVAVKLLLKEHQNPPRLRQQFANEARITGRLQHPGIVPIYQTGTSHDDRPYFAMKLGKHLRNCSPRDRLRKRVFLSC